jgi:acyl carrier protein
MDQFETIQLTVIKVIRDYLEANGQPETINEHTALIGSNSVLSSIGLVTVIVDIESTLSEKGIDVLILSEKAMSLTTSPFRSVGSLTNFIIQQVKEQNEK